MNERPQVCAIVANYQYGRYLKDCIEGLLAQTYPCRIAIFDDGSTDNSRDVIFEYISRESKYREEENLEYYHDGAFTAILNKNSGAGPSFGRNSAIREVWDETELFLISDADDIPMPNKIEELSKPILEYPFEVGVTYADYIIEDVETANRIAEFKWPYDRNRLYNECIPHSQALISKLALESIEEDGKWFREDMRTCEDWMNWVRISRKFMFVHIPKLLTLVRNHKSNSTHTVQNEIWQANWQKVREEVLKGLS